MLIQSTKRLDARKLAEACEMTERTIYRDLKMLEAAGIPYYFDKSTGGYSINRGFFMPPVELTLEESLAVIALAGQVGGDEQIPFMKPAVKAADKIRSRLPAAIRDQIGTMADHIEMRLARSVSPDGIADTYELVRRAIAGGRALECVYESSSSRNRLEQPGKIFLFRPYCLFWGKRAWYAIGHHEGRDEIRCLKLNRFSRMGLTDVPYAIPDGFTLKDYLGKAWRMIRGKVIYSIELRFDKEFAETVSETHWHETQEIENHDDGSITFRCEVAGLDEIVWWILSMGPHCRVLKPKILANRVCALAGATAAMYTKSIGRPSRRDTKVLSNNSKGKSSIA